jgi:hypothetical protein
MQQVHKVAIMQPYLFPYIGYWQLINAVDTFVIYDEIEYTKRGWINRNRLLKNGEPSLFSLPIKKGSDHLFVNQRYLSDQASKDKQKLLRQFEGAYRKAPFYNEGMEVLNYCLANTEKNLFEFIFHSIIHISNLLGITTKIVKSSSLGVDNYLKSEAKVLSICSSLRANQYINPIGGELLYNKKKFAQAGLELKFQKVRDFSYNQFDKKFSTHLSIIDVIMFNGVEKTKDYLIEIDYI